VDENFLIREGVKADIQRLSHIEHDAAQRFGDVDGYDFCADGAIREDHEFQRGLDEGALMVGMTAAGAIAGFALLWRVDGNAHLTELNVERRLQGRGLGRLLVDHAENWARAQHLDVITLTTFRDISWNRPYYEALGYSVFTARPEHTGMAAIIADEYDYGFRAKPRVEMRKQL